MSIILKMIEERENKILTFGEKTEERKKLLEQLTLLEKEISEFDKDTLVAEIEELTACAVKLNLIQIPQEDTNSEESTLENSLTMEV